MKQEMHDSNNFSSNKQFETAILAGGCFWCIEAPMQRVKGVFKAISGYIGGHVDNPSYQQICSGTSGHAEAVRIDFNPNEITFQQLLEVFFALHDPTQLNKQGNDCGTQYRSAIFYQSNEQMNIAKEAIASLSQSGNYNTPIVTTLEANATFYVAEVQHQNFYDKQPYQPYCQIIIAPKLKKLGHLFSDKLK